MINKVHLGDWTNNQLEDKSVKLIIADPPYFEVKGEFDFIWDSFDDYLKEEFKKANITNKEIAKLFPSKTGRLTGCVSNWLNGDNVITEEQYLKIRDFLNNEYLRKEYEDLRKEYEHKRRYFYNPNKLEEVLEFSQESHITRKYNHDTKKPETLTRALIQTCSRKGDLVLVPFSGSGTECAMAAKEDRDFIGFDIEPKYVEMANARCSVHLKQTTLF